METKVRTEAEILASMKANLQNNKKNSEKKSSVFLDWSLNFYFIVFGLWSEIFSEKEVKAVKEMGLNEYLELKSTNNLHKDIRRFWQKFGSSSTKKASEIEADKIAYFSDKCELLAIYQKKNK